MLKKPRAHMLMLSLSLFSVLVLLLSACGASGTPTPSSSTTPVKGGTWTDDLYEEPDSLIPNASSETFSDLVDETIWEALFVGNYQGGLEPGLATEVPTVANDGVSADLKTWTFHLRKGLEWSDGQPLTAQDVDFTWRYWMNPKFTPASTTGINLITSTTISPDNLSITFHLKQPFEPFASVWADGLSAPIPEHIFKNIPPGSALTSPQNLAPTVASGPFMLTSSKPGTSYTVSRNPHYFLASQGLPYLDKIVFRIVTNTNTILKDLQAGTIDSSWFLDVTQVPAYKALTNYTLTANPNASNFEAIYFDFHNPILGTDVDVRKAIAMAIDHQALITTARRGEAVPLCTDHGKSYVPGYQANAPCPPFDPQGAIALLKSDGWTVNPGGVDTRVVNGKTERLEFQYSTTANNFWRADDELVMQSDMSAIGIKLDISNYPASTFFGPFLTGGQPGKYDIAEFEDSFSYDADDYSLLACSQIPPAGFNVTFYCNHQLDNLFIQEESTDNPTQRQQIFDQIHQIYLTQFPFITLYGPVDLGIHKNNTHNYAPGPEGASETIGVQNWWCSGGQC